MTIEYISLPPMGLGRAFDHNSCSYSGSRLDSSVYQSDSYPGAALALAVPSRNSPCSSSWIDADLTAGRNTCKALQGTGELSPSAFFGFAVNACLAPVVYVTDVRTLQDLRMFQQGRRLSSRRWRCSCSGLAPSMGFTYRSPAANRGLLNCVPMGLVYLLIPLNPRRRRLRIRFRLGSGRTVGS